jgi:hypothetical protein
MEKRDRSCAGDEAVVWSAQGLYPYHGLSAQEGLDCIVERRLPQGLALTIGGAGDAGGRDAWLRTHAATPPASPLPYRMCQQMTVGERHRASDIPCEDGPSFPMPRPAPPGRCRRKECTAPHARRHAACIAPTDVSSPACAGLSPEGQRPEDQRPEGGEMGETTTRNPTSSSLRYGKYLNRYAQRRYLSKSMNAPPRNTRRTASSASRFSRPSLAL